MIDVQKLLKQVVNVGASDLHMTVGVPPMVRINGELTPVGTTIMKPDMTEDIAKQILTEEKWQVLKEKGQVDFSLSITGVNRFRVNVFRQRNSYGIAIRSVMPTIPSFKQLGLPPVVQELTTLQRGLVLVTGPTGSGKSTTLACMIQEINNTRKEHIITLEEPIEYFHRHNKSMVNQREIGSDCQDFAGALRAALRQDPDVILIGEMRDLETISTALTAAETGHLVFSTLHTTGAAKTIDRIIDVFPPHQQGQVRTQLSLILKAVISQQLLLTKDQSKRVAALEVMTLTPAISNLIREGKTHQIQSHIQTGKAKGMISMDASLCDMCRQGVISRDSAITHAVDREYVKRILGV